MRSGIIGERAAGEPKRALFTLTVMTGPDRGQVLTSSAEESVVGRDPGPGLVLTDRSVSRKHCRLVRVSEGVFEIEDLQSGNGTLVNGQHISRHRLLEGDLVTVGKNTLRFHLESAAGAPAEDPHAHLHRSMTITMQDLRKELQAQRATKSDWDALQRARQDLAAVYRTGQILNSLQTTDQLYPRLLDILLAELPRADRASLLLMEGQSDAFTVQMSRSRGASAPPPEQALYSLSLVRAALDEEGAILVSDSRKDERFSARESVMAQNIRSAICVPLETTVGVHGVLYVDTVASSEVLIEEDLKLLSMIGLQAAAAVESTRLYERLHEEKVALAEANRRLKAAQQQLIQSEKLAGIGQLTAGIVHDIRNPITVILGHAQCLLGVLKRHALAECDQKEFEESLREIEGGVLHCNEIVGQLLSFARQNKPQMAVVDLNALVADTLKFLGPEAGKAKVRFMQHLQPDLPSVLADANQLKQVFINIVINGLQAMPQGGNLVVASGVHTDELGRMAQVSFADSGVGMTREQLTKIFDPFFTTKAPGQGAGGTGLGLSVSYGIIQNHGGKIAVTSEPGKGACFTVMLPLPKD